MSSNLSGIYISHYKEIKKVTLPSSFWHELLVVHRHISVLCGQGCVAVLETTVLFLLK